MATLKSVLGNVGPDGAAVTAVNLGVDVVSVTPTPLYTSTSPIEGTFSVIFQGSGGNNFAQAGFTSGATRYASVYFIMPSVVSAATNILSLRQGATLAASSARVNTDLSMTLRDLNTAVGTATSPIPAGSLVRVELKATPGSAGGTACEMKVWVGANANGTTTPDYTKAGANTSTTATAVDTVVWGAISSGTDFKMDRLIVDDTAYPTPMTSSAPTINAGPDLIKDSGSSSFTIVPAYTIPSGRTLTSISVSQTGTTVTTTGGTTGTPTLTVTPPVSGTGTTTFTFTVVDSLGGTATDAVTVTWVAPGQVFRPSADGAATSPPWVASNGGALYSNIDEVTPTTADEITSPDTPTGQEQKIRLTPLPAPVDFNNVVLTLGLYLDSGVTSQSVVIKLYDSDGTTVRKTVTWTDLTTTPTLRQLALTSGEAGAITGWNVGLWYSIAPTLS